MNGPFAVRVAVLSAALWSCTTPSPCPKGASLTRLPDRALDGGVAVLCRTATGTLDGPVTLTWDGTRARLTGRFEQGRQAGPWTWWHANGTKRASYAFAPGARPSGTWETWHPNGKPQWRLTFSDGAPNGPVQEFREDGSRRFEGAFTAGEPSGVWTAWYRSGARAGEGQYAAGRPVGRWMVWWKGGAVAGLRDGGPDWVYAGPDGGVLTRPEWDALLHPAPEGSGNPLGGLLGGLVMGEAREIDDGPPDFVPPLTVPTDLPSDPFFPWGKLHGVWFDEFRLELHLQPEDLE